jgi:hypothetical protein
MRRLVSIAALVLGIGVAPVALAQSDRYVPALADIMSGAQWRHIKLWFAGKQRNWELAKLRAAADQSRAGAGRDAL